MNIPFRARITTFRNPFSFRSSFSTGINCLGAGCTAASHELQADPHSGLIGAAMQAVAATTKVYLSKRDVDGRKNWFFVGIVEAGERSARLVSVVSGAKWHQLDVWFYLKDLVDRMLAGETNYSKFVPELWKREHLEAVRTYREE
jgi:hypothetical protein